MCANLFNQLPEAPPRQWVDAGGRLVQDKQVWFVDQRAAKAQLLLHAPRQLAGRALGKALQVGGLQQIGHALFTLTAAQPEQGGKKTDVLADRQFRVQVVAQPLRHERHFGVERRAMAALADRATQHLQLSLL
ncbi:hypothetical protein D9M71_355080 [compost metagenome]